MLAAVVLVRMGRVLAMNAASPAAARRRRLICFALATVLMIAATPWAGLANGRPLFRLPSD
jgi:TRAP-type C4-dicarboxylate transport system permease small subunit